ncbi:ATP-dependent helicase/nuclease subunit B [Haloferula luteola]|uniref:ATP-dependent helicase/nuclease subunit B n=1 Tax=Haloferula luteola TaxID=595692 RepID=A0A840V3B7_9BACT|nr:PD-(D/E)XK nuclease family protein [Haloferula luteola]MBB5350154.1 ATP-dependent helicase/nuclease subunit B [Haloferula luteola]
MDRRVFLGWDRPLLGRVVEWLWARREELPHWQVVVPTAQAGRRVREALAEKGACLAPRVVTPGQLLVPEGAVSRGVEVAAWVEALEGVDDWTPFEAVFREPPHEGEAPGWGLSLARSLVDLERSLRENTLAIPQAAKWMESSIEAERWRALAELSRRRDEVLRQWGGTGANRALAEAPKFSGKWIFAGVWDFPEALVQRMEVAEVTCLLAAPESEAALFDAWGRPLPEAWAKQTLDWPEVGGVHLTAHARHQAQRAVEQVAAARTKSDALTLGCADEETASELVRAFQVAGWQVHHPGAVTGSGARAWLKSWRRFVLKPEAAEAIDLLGFAATSALVGGQRAQRVEALSRLRDAWLVRDEVDVKRVAAMDARSAGLAELAEETLSRLLQWRGGFLRLSFPEAMANLMDRVDAAGEWGGLREAVDGISVVAERSHRPTSYWLDLVLGELTGQVAQVPEGRVVDVLGWFELLHADGEHLVMAGLNEGRVPSPSGANPWLSEGVRESLELGSEAQRGARDAFVLRAVMEARRESGRVDLLLAKSGGDGDALLPSRLLLAAEGEELARRVKGLFQGVEPPDAGVAFEVDWRWRPERREVRVKEGRQSLSVSAFKDYLACPFRFYLKHGLGMSRSEPERVEWNARDFGNVAHEILEAWGLDPEARELNKREALQAYFNEQVTTKLAERFGDRVPLAARMQAESLKQRLGWFARWQGAQHAEGWRVEAVEKKFEFELAGVTVRGTIDRIDRRGDEIRVLDYKTFAKLQGREVRTSHVSKVTAALRIPEHLEGVKATRVSMFSGQSKNPSEHLWRDLQVPLYAVALGEVSAMGYFVLGASEGECDGSWWGPFDEEQRESAVACATWVLEQVKAGVFWPPAKKTKYDDFEALAVGRPLEDLVMNPNDWRDGYPA